LVDARSLISSVLFERILVMRSAGNDSDPEIGDQCLVATDGRQHYVLGILPRTEVDPDGNPTTRNTTNDLVRSKDAVSLVSSDDFGNSARITASRGYGVVVDGGEFCVTHHDPGRREIHQYSERASTFSIPLMEKMDHDGIFSTYICVHKTSVDPEGMVRDLELKTDLSICVGSSFIKEVQGNTCKYSTRFNGVETTSDITDALTGDREEAMTGKRTIKASSGIVIESDGVTGDVIIRGGVPLNLTIKITSAGKISIGNGTVDLLDIIDQFLTAASTTLVPTALGPQRPEPLATTATILQTLLQVIKA
jgi:hypothetical protein